MSIPALRNGEAPASQGLPTSVFIPRELVSLATIKYLGYNDEAAADIWGRWTARFPSGQPQELEPVLGKPFLNPIIEFSYYRFDLDADDGDDSKWLDCMGQCGINQATQTAIMDPVYKRVRLTRSCLHWLRDTMKLRYRTLKEVLEARARGPPGVSTDFAMSEAALFAVPAMTTLYKSVDTASIPHLFDKDGNVKNIADLATSAPIDFCGREISYTFALELDIALLDACWAKARSNLSCMVIIQATLWNSTIRDLSGQELQRVYWPSEEWKQLVFCSRRRLRLPPELRRFKEASLIVGTSATKSDTVYGRMDCPHEITEEMVYKTKDGRNYVTIFDNAAFIYLNGPGPVRLLFT
ncbi:hypothetical protein MKX07_002872 [Trichoderma sp. CBMAI-0711]|nr:hypothetical protein MKX07_002872 [Trichoderma sp. CBMAI-0711]